MLVGCERVSQLRNKNVFKIHKHIYTQGSHRNSKTKFHDFFHDFSMINNVIYMII